MTGSAEQRSPLQAESPERHLNSEKMLGVRFFCGLLQETLDYFLTNGGLLVIPASPALTKLKYDEQYRRALTECDVALLDSGFVAMVWKVLTGRSVSRISSAQYLKALLADRRFRASDVLWLVSSSSLQVSATEWFGRQGFDNRRHSFHVSDLRSPDDHALLLKIEQQNPAHIVIAAAGGMQEKLGLYLRDYLLYQPCIHCVGSGLAFLTSCERPIPPWAEALRIGWLFRLIAQPRMILPRIGIALALWNMLRVNRSELPPLQMRWADV